MILDKEKVLKGRLLAIKLGCLALCVGFSVACSPPAPPPPTPGYCKPGGGPGLGAPNPNSVSGMGKLKERCAACSGMAGGSCRECAKNHSFNTNPEKDQVCGNLAINAGPVPQFIDDVIGRSGDGLGPQTVLSSNVVPTFAGEDEIPMVCPDGPCGGGGNGPSDVERLIGAMHPDVVDRLTEVGLMPDLVGALGATLPWEQPYVLNAIENISIPEWQVLIEPTPEGDIVDYLPERVDQMVYERAAAWDLNRMVTGEPDGWTQQDVRNWVLTEELFFGSHGYNP